MNRGMCDSSQVASKEKRGTFQEQFLHFWHFIVQRSIHVAGGSTLYSCALFECVALKIRFPPNSIIGKGANFGQTFLFDNAIETEYSFRWVKIWPF